MTRKCNAIFCCICDKRLSSVMDCCATNSPPCQVHGSLWHMNANSQTPKRSADWSAIRRQIAEWPKPALLALVKDLHDASPENRDFLRARFDAENAGGEALESYRRKIIEQFFPQRGSGKLKLTT